MSSIFYFKLPRASERISHPAEQNDDLINKCKRFADIFLCKTEDIFKNSAMLQKPPKFMKQKKSVELEIMFPGSLERRSASVFPSL